MKTKPNNSAFSRCLIIVVFGVLISLYLVFHTTSVRGGYLFGESACNLGGVFNCDKVAASGHAMFLGVQVASWGLWYYLVFLSLLLFLRRDETEEGMERGITILFFLSALSIPPTLYLLSVSVLSLGFICIFCFLSYLINALLVFVFWRASSGGPIGQRLWSGGRGFFQRYLFRSSPDASGSGAISSGVLLWLLLLISGAVSLGLPGSLEHYYFQPRQGTYLDGAKLKVLFQKWKEAPRVDLENATPEGVPDGDFSYGEPDAELTLHEFSDFQCPFCRRASKVVKPIVAQFKGRVRIVFKNYPLDPACNKLIEHSGHEYACQAAYMARCAGMQSKNLFWEMHDRLFSLDHFTWSFEALFELPAEIQGLDMEAFDSCLGDPKTKMGIERDLLLGNESEVQGTPTIFANGKKLSFEQLEQLPGLIEMILEDQS